MSDRSVPEGGAPVAIVGAGPTGLSLALGLARQGVRSVLLERNAATSNHSRAPGIHVRTREALRQWGVEDDFLKAGVLRRELSLHNAAPGRGTLLHVDFNVLHREADRPGLVLLEQGRTEKLLLAAVEASGLCHVRFDAEVIGLKAGTERVRITTRSAGTVDTLDARLAVGCDGAGSFVRQSLGLPFDGMTYSIRPMLADVRVGDLRDAQPWPRLRNTRGGLTFTFRLRPGLWRIIRLDRARSSAGAGGEGGEGGEGDDHVPEEEVNERVTELLGPGPVEIVWASRFRIHRRASPRFRVGRVLLAGDAAHIHSPAGGLGMNAGIQDAHNLAWKLARALGGGAMDRLLDSYHVERHAVVVEDVSRYADLTTRAFLQSPALLREAAFFLWRWATRLPPVRHTALRRATMIDLDYPASPILDPSERAAGVRLPNPPLRSRDGSEVRLYDLLPYRATLLDINPERRAADPPPGSLPVAHVIRIGPGARTDPTGALQELVGGRRGWVLVRPDAHIAWARGDTSDVAAIRDAMERALGGTAGESGEGERPPEPAGLDGHERGP
jgi:2-polyprenyl-6-methoxyphenol hydroxylase-like FAD-dependent oxidoreductase